MITVEDYNSYLGKYGLINTYYELDTSLIYNDGSTVYEDVLYDFVKVTHTVSGSTHTYSFEVVNTGWNGNFYLCDSDGGYISNASYSYDDDILSFSSTNANITLVLQLCNVYDEFNVNYLTSKLLTSNVSYDTHPSSYEFEDLSDGSTSTVSAGAGWIQELDTNVYAVRFTKKLTYAIADDLSDVILTSGMYHELQLTEDDVTLEVSYLDKTELIDASDDPTLVIDLKNVYDISKLSLKIKVFGNYKFVEDTLNISLPVQPITVNTYSDLQTNLNKHASVIEVNDDITLTNQNITIKANTIIRGTGETPPTLSLNYNMITINEGVTVTLENLTIIEGNPAILQKKDSKLTIKKCSFINNRNKDKGDIGSVVDCDIDITSLDIIDDFITNITDSVFIDNHSCILHGGELTVKDCKYHNTDTWYCNINNPAFLYQIDGNASVTDSVFDITYDDNTFNTHGIMYGQALFMIGSTATINDMTAGKIVEDNNVNWCNAPYNNVSHLFAKYYYSKVSEMVYSSPRHGFEDKNLAYCVSGVDWVFKANTMITKASEESENRNTKISW